MASIDVVPKQRSSMMWVWMLIVAAIVVAVLWWMFAAQGSSPGGRTGALSPGAERAAVPAAV